MQGNPCRSATSYSRELHCSDKYELRTLKTYGYASQSRSDRLQSSAQLDRSAGGETVFCARAPAADGRHGIALDWPPVHGYNGLGTAPDKEAVLKGNERVFRRVQVWWIAFYAERRRYGERVSTGFVESAVNTVVGKRQQMEWSKPSAHLLLQSRARTLDGTLRGKFEQWYPGLKTGDTPAEAEPQAA